MPGGVIYCESWETTHRARGNAVDGRVTFRFLTAASFYDMPKEDALEMLPDGPVAEPARLLEQAGQGGVSVLDLAVQGYEDLDYTPREGLVRIHSIPCYGNDCVEVVGAPDEGCYEWGIRKCGMLLEHSNEGYGDPAVALREGLVRYYGAGADGGSSNDKTPMTRDGAA